jgi:hypothetical protein
LSTCHVPVKMLKTAWALCRFKKCSRLYNSKAGPCAYGSDMPNMMSNTTWHNHSQTFAKCYTWTCAQNSQYTYSNRSVCHKTHVQANLSMLLEACIQDPWFLLFDAVAVYRYECMYVCWQVWVCVRVFVISFRYMNACMCMYVCVCVHLRMQKKLGVCCMYVCTCNKPRWTSHCVHVTPKEYSREAFCHVCRLIHKQHAYLIFVAAHYLQWAAAHETFSAHVYHTHTNKICSRPPFSSHAVMMWW